MIDIEMSTYDNATYSSDQRDSRSSLRNVSKTTQLQRRAYRVTAVSVRTILRRKSNP